MSLKSVLSQLEKQQAGVKQNGDKMNAQQLSTIYAQTAHQALDTYESYVSSKKITSEEYKYLYKSLKQVNRVKSIDSGKKLSNRLNKYLNILNVELKSQSKVTRLQAQDQKQHDNWIEPELKRIKNNVFYTYKDSKNNNRDIPSDFSALNAKILLKILKNMAKATKNVVQTSTNREKVPSISDESSHIDMSQIISPISSGSNSSNNQSQNRQNATNQSKKPKFLHHVTSIFSGKVKNFLHKYDEQKSSTNTKSPNDNTIQHINSQQENNASNHTSDINKSNTSSNTANQKSQSSVTISSTTKSSVSSNQPKNSSGSKPLKHSTQQVNHSVSNKGTQKHSSANISSSAYASLASSASHSASVSVANHFASLSNSAKSSISASISSSLAESSVSASISASNSTARSLKASHVASISVSASVSASVSTSNSLSLSASSANSMQAQQKIKQHSLAVSTSQSLAQKNQHRAQSVQGNQQMATKPTATNNSQKVVSSLTGIRADNEGIRKGAINFINKFSTLNADLQSSASASINIERAKNSSLAFKIKTMRSSASKTINNRSLAGSADLLKAHQSADSKLNSVVDSVEIKDSNSASKQLRSKAASAISMKSSALSKFHSIADNVESNNKETYRINESSVVDSIKSSASTSAQNYISSASNGVTQANSNITYYSQRAEFYSNALSMFNSYCGDKARQINENANDISRIGNQAQQKISNYHGKAFPKFNNASDLQRYLSRNASNKQYNDKKS